MKKYSVSAGNQKMQIKTRYQFLINKLFKRRSIKRIGRCVEILLNACPYKPYNNLSLSKTCDMTNHIIKTIGMHRITT